MAYTAENVLTATGKLLSVAPMDPRGVVAHFQQPAHKKVVLICELHLSTCGYDPAELLIPHLADMCIEHRKYAVDALCAYILNLRLSFDQTVDFTQVKPIRFPIRG